MTNPITPPEVENALDSKKIPKAPEHKNNQSVFGKGGVSPEQATLAKTASSIGTNIQTLSSLQEMNPNPERTKQIIDLERQRGRVGRFAYLRNRGAGTDEQKSIQKQILGKKETLEDIKSSDLLLLKKNGVDLINLLLVSDTNPTGSVTRDTIKEKDKFIVNFGDNKNINDLIGAGDILPPIVNQVKITSKKYRAPEGIIATRGYDPRPGYYDISRQPPVYIPIYDGDKLEIITIGSINEKDMKVAGESEDKWLRERRIEDMIDSGGKALSELPEDKKLEMTAQEEIKQRKEIRDRIGDMRVGKFIGTTNKPISETVKALKDLNVVETNNLLIKVFGKGPGTDLLIAIDDGSTFAIKRMITLAYHEGGLVFGRQNLDPASGFNIGTFQIGGRDSTRESSLNKYEKCLQAGIRLAGEKNITVDYKALKDDAAQRDLLTHLGYINSERHGSETFSNLRNPNLSDNEVIQLMHHDIQGGISAIGQSVVSQVNNTKIDLMEIQSA